MLIADAKERQEEDSRKLNIVRAKNQQLEEYLRGGSMHSNTSKNGAESPVFLPPQKQVRKL